MTKTTKEKHIPQRMCTVCRQRLPKNSLMRFVETKDGLYKIDLKAREAGRGKYLCYDYNCLESLIKPVKKPPFMLEKNSMAILEGLHAEQRSLSDKAKQKKENLLGILGIGRKASLLSIGFDAVAEAIRSGQAQCLVLAEDISENSLNKIRKLIIEYKIQTASALKGKEIGQAVGKSKVVILSINDAGLAHKFMQVLQGMSVDLNELLEE